MTISAAMWPSASMVSAMTWFRRPMLCRLFAPGSGSAETGPERLALAGVDARPLASCVPEREAVRARNIRDPREDEHADHELQMPGRLPLRAHRHRLGHNLILPSPRAEAAFIGGSQRDRGQAGPQPRRSLARRGGAAEPARMLSCQRRNPRASIT